MADGSNSNHALNDQKQISREGTYIWLSNTNYFANNMHKKRLFKITPPDGCFQIKLR